MEHKRRDDSNVLSHDHKHVQFTEETTVPTRWRDQCLSCRECKRNLVLYLGEYFLDNAQSLLRSQQKRVIARCFRGHAEDQAWVITSNDKQPDHSLCCTAEEADTRVWLHALTSSGSHTLVCSPDTDIYHIGLPLMSRYPCEVVVQLSAIASLEHHFLSLTQLCTALDNDPDLSTVPCEVRPSLLESLFICSGCYYVTFFVSLGKAIFLRICLQHYDFINADSVQLPGTLACMSETTMKYGFLAFVRLIGTIYFKKHLACFHHDSSRALYNSMPCEDPGTQHRQWLSTISSTMWERVEFEDQLPPS